MDRKLLLERNMDVEVDRKVISDLIKETLKSEWDKEEKELNGAYVYRLGSLLDLDFERYDTIADAVRNALKLDGAKVICNGEIITFDRLRGSREGQAYYIDDRIHKMKIIRL